MNLRSYIDSAHKPMSREQR